MGEMVFECKQDKTFRIMSLTSQKYKILLPGPRIRATWSGWPWNYRQTRRNWWVHHFVKFYHAFHIELTAPLFVDSRVKVCASRFKMNNCFLLLTVKYRMPSLMSMPSAYGYQFGFARLQFVSHENVPDSPLPFNRRKRCVPSEYISSRVPRLLDGMNCTKAPISWSSVT